MGLFQQTETTLPTTKWPDERIEVDDREFAEAIERGRRNDDDQNHDHN